MHAGEKGVRVYDKSYPKVFGFRGLGYVWAEAQVQCPLVLALLLKHGLDVEEVLIPVEFIYVIQ